MKYLIFALTLICLVDGCKPAEPPLFLEKEAAATGLSFSNTLTDTEQENVLAYEYYYNGGGVGVADFNNDGLTDVFLSGNQVENKLYLNTTKSGQSASFQDITKEASITKPVGSWATGVSVADVNGDGWVDVYVCYSGNKPAALRRNQLYINQGANKQGIPSFKEEAEAYGLADTSYSTAASFFDMDLDGDLDLFLLNHNLRNYQRKESATMRQQRDPEAGDKLFENREGKFIDISAEAGIKGNPMGFGLGIAVADINTDGLPDIYITNDYVEDDYLYINEGNGRFTDQLRKYLGHTSQFSMGVNLADVTNDAQPDIFTLDMLPEDNYRQKKLIWPDNWSVYQAQLKAGFWHQNMRNMLHIGLRDSLNHDLHFAEVGQLWGVSNTDWSWSALAADFDADGFKDYFVTNGIGKDYTDADFVKYYYDDKTQRGLQTTLLEDLKQMPSTPTKHAIFRNIEGQKFEDKRAAWGFDKQAIASGAAAADFDNDGDIDLITNRLNQTVGYYENQSEKKNTLQISLVGEGKNTKGIGAKLKIFTATTTQFYEVSATQGFQSSCLSNIIIGLNTATAADSVQITWPSGKEKTYKGFVSNKLHVLKEQEASVPPTHILLPPLANTYITDTSSYRHQRPAVNDFDRQSLLIKSYSFTGPRTAVADVDGDQRPDVFFCGTTAKSGEWVFGSGRRLAIGGKNQQDVAVFDADNDGDLDLYIACGGYSDFAGSSNLQDELYWNDGSSNFSLGSLPTETHSASFVKVLDVDNNGLKDIVVGGSVIPNQFPQPDETFLLRNLGKGQFVKETLGKIGLTTDAAIVDYNQDTRPDLLLVGDFMPLTFFKNVQGKFQFDSTLPATNGSWNRILAEDIDGDGDSDLVIGNMGLNTQWKPSEATPLELTYSDADGNGIIDPIFAYYIQGVSHPALSRDNLIEQLPFLRKFYTHYAPYANETMQGLREKLPAEGQEIRQIVEARTGIFENTGGQFVFHALPQQAQYAPIHAMAFYDVNGDGKNELLLGGNEANYRWRFGRMDASKVSLFKLDNKLQFRYAGELGIEGDVRDIQPIGKQLLITRLNNTAILLQKR